MKNQLFLDMAEAYFQKEGIELSKKSKNMINTNYFEVDNNNYKGIKRDIGKYYTLDFTEEVLTKFPHHLKKEIIKILKSFKNSISNYGTTLIIGLGNSSVLPDSLGPKTTNQIIATNHYVDFLTIPKVALFVPEVIGKTGISSFDLIKMVVNTLKPSSIIVIDSLETKNPHRLNKCIEISNAGIIPGGAIKTNRKISYKTFNIPIISIGVPLVIKIAKYKYSSLDIEEQLSKISKVLADSLNELFLK